MTLVLVPGKAKSAATIISMGASKIIMSQSSELGPVDPQIIRKEDDINNAFSAHNLVAGYDRLFAEVAKTSGPIEPFLHDSDMISISSTFRPQDFASSA